MAYRQFAQHLSLMMAVYDDFFMRGPALQDPTQLEKFSDNASLINY
jgi:hypothetical protein